VTGVELVALAFGTLLALAVGSFLCVVIDRLPVELDEPNEYGDLYDTRPWSEVLGGTSRCSDCGEPIRGYENIPVLSWLLLRGRCRSCGSAIPAFHPVVEALVPALFLLMVWAIGWDWRLAPVLGLLPGAVVVGAIDLRTMIVPTRVVWPSLGLVVVLSVLATVAVGVPEWLLVSAVGLLTLAGPLFVLWFVVPSGMGFGDVRLAVLLGWTVGFYAGAEPIAGVLLAMISLVLAALLGVVLGVVVMGARGRKARVPFGPSLVAGALFTIAYAPTILEPFRVYSLS